MSLIGQRPRSESAGEAHLPRRGHPARSQHEWRQDPAISSGDSLSRSKRDSHAVRAAGRMPAPRSARVCLAACTLLAAFLQPLRAQTTITWNSEANKVNRTSAGQLMDAAFRFELGVFADGFEPRQDNVAEWAAHWTAAQRRPYDASNKRYSGSHNPPGNEGPFAVDAPAYVWGFRGNGTNNEWILFRADGWKWPYIDPFLPAPSFEEWFAKDATAVVGQIHASGSPFLMKSASVANAAPPPTTWDQWRVDHLTGETLDQPGDDPDRDGTPNLLEFVFGTLPRAANAPVATPLSLVSGHLQIAIPRRVDHQATLIVEVSSDLQTWRSGPAHTATVSDTLSAWVVSDLTPIGGANPQRFLRLRAVLP